MFWRLLASCFTPHAAAQAASMERKAWQEREDYYTSTLQDRIYTLEAENEALRNRLEDKVYD